MRLSLILAVLASACLSSCGLLPKRSQDWLVKKGLFWTEAEGRHYGKSSTPFTSGNTYQPAPVCVTCDNHDHYESHTTVIQKGSPGNSEFGHSQGGENGNGTD